MNRPNGRLRLPKTPTGEAVKGTVNATAGGVAALALAQYADLDPRLAGAAGAAIGATSGVLGGWAGERAAESRTGSFSSLLYSLLGLLGALTLALAPLQARAGELTPAEVEGGYVLAAGVDARTTRVCFFDSAAPEPEVGCTDKVVEPLEDGSFLVGDQALEPATPADRIAYLVVDLAEGREHRIRAFAEANGVKSPPSDDTYVVDLRPPSKPELLDIAAQRIEEALGLIEQAQAAQ